MYGTEVRWRPRKKPKSPKHGLNAPTLIRSTKHLKYVRSLRCAAALCERRDIEAAHVSDCPSSERGGIGEKASDVMVAPLCREHHREAHQHGHPTFERNHMPPNITLAEYAIRIVAPTSPDVRIRERAAELRSRL